MRYLTSAFWALVLLGNGQGFSPTRRWRSRGFSGDWPRHSAASKRFSEDVKVQTLLVDNYDSYTYNLFQLLSVVNGCEPVVITNDQFSARARHVLDLLPTFDNVVLSPGPGRPDREVDFGICKDILREYEGPLLGVCLGHQGLGLQHGGVVTRAPNVMHGRLSRVYHAGEGLFKGIASGEEAVRYHSLIVDRDALVNGPSQLKPTAWTDDGIIMALEHVSRPHFGVQFHPESIGTLFGRKLLENFRVLSLQYNSKDHRGSHALPRSQRSVRSDCAWPTPLGLSSEQDIETKEESKHLLEDSKPRSFDVVASQVPGRITAEDVEQIFADIFGAEATSFWLDSSSVNRWNAGDGNPHEARWSYFGAPTGPEAFTYTYRGPRHGLMTFPANRTTVAMSGDVFNFMEKTIAQVDVSQVFVSKGSSTVNEALQDELEQSLIPFVGGLVGFIGYECRHDVEILRSQRASEPESEAFLRDPHVPDAFYLFTDRVLAYDHKVERLVVLHLVPVDDESGRHQATEWCDEVVRRVEKLKKEGERSVSCGLGGLEELQFRVAVSRDEYVQKIDSCHDYIRQGESYEICLTTQLSAHLQDKSSCHHPRQSLEFYRRLRRKNPAPYGAFLFHDPQELLGTAAPERRSDIPSDAFAICCSSPERFLRVRNGVVESKPIKGTVRRNSVDPVADRRLARELEQSVKNRAENLMIVDLVRNDLGRVCEVGTVTVPRLMAVETYETVHQLVSTVRGQVRRGVSIVDAIKACFPGGSMTGAPKVRTLDIIHDLENEAPRGVYSGTLGFVSASGNSDLNIVIRTAVITPTKVTIGAGGAVTALSDRDDEYEEMLLKADAVLRTVGAGVQRDSEQNVDSRHVDRPLDRRNFTIPEVLLN